MQASAYYLMTIETVSVINAELPEGLCGIMLSRLNHNYNFLTSQNLDRSGPDIVVGSKFIQANQGLPSAFRQNGKMSG